VGEVDPGLSGRFPLAALAKIELEPGNPSLALPFFLITTKLIDN
jgi:hypothetical protein